MTGQELCALALVAAAGAWLVLRLRRSGPVGGGCATRCECASKALENAGPHNSR